MQTSSLLSLTTRIIATRRLLRHGCGLPAARDLAQRLLRRDLATLLRLVSRG